MRVVVLVGSFVLAALAATIVAGDPAWPVMALWFLGVVAVHDGVLVPLVGGVDRVLVRFAPPTGVPVVNHVRVPFLASGLTLLVHLPGIVRQGEATHLAATGLDQEPYLGRWLLLVATFAAVSALVYGVRVARSR
jgi:hypothetical protein